jgi:hypothetical protein
MPSFCFLALFSKDFFKYAFDGKILGMDSGLGAIHAGAKVTQFGVVNVGVKPPCHLADDAELALTWQHLDAVTIGVKLGAIVIGAKAGATDQLPCISFFILSISRSF